MKVTKIEKQRSNDNLNSVYIDNKFAFSLNDEDLIKFKIKPECEINQRDYEYILEYIVYLKAKTKAYNLLAYKARTEKELRDKLLKENYNNDIIDRIIDLLKKYNYINDEEYTKSYIANSIKLKPLSKKMLKYDLLKKGIDINIIETVIKSSDIDELQTAVRLLEKKLKGKKEVDQKEKERAFNYLLRRGFNYEIINKAFREINI